MLLALANRPMMHRLLKAGVVFLIHMLLLGGSFGLLCRLGCWWANVLWGVLMSVALAVFVLGKAHGRRQQLLPAVIIAVLTGMAVGTGSLWACFRIDAGTGAFLAVMALVQVQLYAALPLALQAYLSSVRHTNEHYLYLRANGATHLEALMPSIRYALKASVLPLAKGWVRPLVVTPPLLLCGLLMAGSSPVAAVLATVLASGAMLMATVVAVVLLLWLADYRLFVKLPRNSP